MYLDLYRDADPDRVARRRRDGALPRRGPANVPGCDRGPRSGLPAHDNAGWPADRPCIAYALRDEAFKFIYDTRTGAEELYDLAADPGERRNIVGSEALRAALYRQSMHLGIAEVVRRRVASDEQARPTSEQCENLRALGYVSVAGCR